MSVRGFRDRFRDYTPKWLQNRPELNAAYRTMWMTIVGLDVMVQAAIEGKKDAFPSFADPSAYSALGSSRGFIRGPAETDGSWVTRLLEWLETWKDAGADVVVARQLQAYVGGAPMVRIVDRSGHWTTLASDGSVSVVDAAWDWDSQSDPDRNDPATPCWSDLWIVIYSPPWAITGTDLSALVGLWGTHALGTGHGVPRSPLDAILGLVATWKGAHTRVRAIIWSYDPAAFDPADSSTGPDGWWGHWSREDPDNPGTWISSRSESARYWIPFDTNPVPDGGV